MAEALAQFTSDLFNISLEEAELGLGIFFTSAGLFILALATFLPGSGDIMDDY